MLLKTYRASSLAAALDQARAELGAEALVLATTEREGRMGLAVVEVTVAAPRQAADPAPSTQPAQLEPPDADEVHFSSRVAAHPPDGFDPAAVDTLVDAGLSRDLAARFARIAADRCPRPARAEDLAHAAACGVQQLIDFRALPASARCLFVVGPPGSGKTTTVAKLAARAVATTNGRVFFAQADRDRIAAFEQAEIFSRYIGSLPARIDGTDDLRCVLEHAGPDGRIFVDTCGVGAHGSDQLAEIGELRRAPGAAVALLLPAGIHAAQAVRILDRFAPLEPDYVGFSRVDEGTRPGELVTALVERRLPLAFFTNGQTVPDDLETASAHSLAALLLRAGRASAPVPEGSR